MKNILIALLIIMVAVSCSKKENEPEPTPPPKVLQNFAFDTTAPFPVPIIDWTKDSKYIKSNPPKGYQIKSEITREKYYFNSGYGISLFSPKETPFTSSDAMQFYHFYQNDKIGIVKWFAHSPSRDSSWYKYFQKKLGEPKNYPPLKVWEAKNVLIITNNFGNINDIVFADPQRVDAFYDESIYPH